MAGVEGIEPSSGVLETLILPMNYTPKHINNIIFVYISQLLNRKVEKILKMLYNIIMKKIEIYTDGACSGNPGAGGWGAILIYNGKEKEISGYEPLTTNNRMEISAVIQALKLLKENCEITIYSDSAYVCNAFNQGWIKNWQQNNWKTSSKKEVLNKDLWQEFLTLLNNHKYKFIKVKGHADNKYNNRCDKLATSEIAKNK